MTLNPDHMAIGPVIQFYTLNYLIMKSYRRQSPSYLSGQAIEPGADQFLENVNNKE